MIMCDSVSFSHSNTKYPWIPLTAIFPSILLLFFSKLENHQFISVSTTKVEVIEKQLVTSCHSLCDLVQPMAIVANSGYQ